MNPRKLYHLIESFGSAELKSPKTLLKHVINEVVRHEHIDVKGARLWVIDPPTRTFKLVYQVGEIAKIELGYRVSFSKYKFFETIAIHRSLLANEQEKELRKRGIKKFLATGVGEKVRIDGKEYYPYLLSFDAEELDQSILPEINIVSIALTSLLRHRSAESQVEELERDIDKAAALLESLFPKDTHHFGDYEIYGISHPERIVGGDFFDIYDIDEENDRLGISIGDAASKGLKAASQALYIMGALRMAVMQHLKISALMARMNSLLHVAFSEDQFVSMFFCELTTDPKGLVIFANAGHNSPIMYKRKRRSFEGLEATGQLLGPFKGEKFRTSSTNFESGDILVMYTDGITEASDLQDELFSEKRLMNVIMENSDLSVHALANKILYEVDQHTMGTSSRDDRTLVIVKRVK